jgi:hypothetical protein
MYNTKDVVCRLFPYTFENSASTWYFNLPVGSITSWTKFQKDFLDKFAEETTTGALMEELFAATMGPKEKVKYFNQIFTTILNKFQPEARPTQELQIEGICKCSTNLHLHVCQKSFQTYLS